MRKINFIDKGLFLKWLAIFFCCQLAILIVCLILQSHVKNLLDNELKDEQLAWLIQTQRSVNFWRNDLDHSARLLSSLDEFTTFASAFTTQEKQWLDKLDNPDFLRVHGENSRAFLARLGEAQKRLEEIAASEIWDGCALVSAMGGLIAKAGRISDTDAISLAKKAADHGQIEYGALRQTSRMAVLDMALPIKDTGAPGSPEIILCLTVPMQSMLSKLLHAESGTWSINPGIVFRDGKSFSRIMYFGDRLAIEPVKMPDMDLTHIPFSERESVDGKVNVYSQGLVLTRPAWALITETPASELTTALNARGMRIYAIGLSCGFLIFLLLLVCWRVGEKSALKRLAGRNAELEAKARNQEQLFATVINALPQGLLLVNGNGTVRSANQELLKLYGKSGNFTGKPMDVLLPREDAAQLLKHLKLVNDIGQSGSMDLTIAAANSSASPALYRVTLFPTPVTDASCGRIGMALFENITSERLRNRMARERQTALIMAMSRAIESVDSNLVGHSDKMGAISEKLARAMRLEENERETLRIASRLSQIGKLFVPRELLQKKGALCEDELEELRRAPDYTDKLLEKLHFDLPVRESARMIGERLNGSGAPYGLMGSEITPVGRILAVANAFVAMTSPRAWRNGGAMSIDEALAHLRADEGFDQNVVAALASLPGEEIASVVGKANEMNYFPS